MNNDIILQNLAEAFDVLKNSWDKKREALIYCIVETETYDGEMALSMWQYIIQKNIRKLSEKEGAEQLFYDVLNRFCERLNSHYNSCSGSNELWVMLDHVSPHLVQNSELIKILFGRSYNAGYKSSYVYREIVSALVASIFLQGNLMIIELLMKALADNKHLVEVSIGVIFRDAFKFIEEISPDSELGERFQFTPEIKGVLINSLDFIKDKEERADCMVTLLSL